jgi:hypothetical protein
VPELSEPMPPLRTERSADPPDLKTKLRDDWQTIKRDARSGGEDIRNAFHRFRDWLVE